MILDLNQSLLELTDLEAHNLLPTSNLQSASARANVACNQTLEDKNCKSESDLALEAIQIGLRASRIDTDVHQKSEELIKRDQEVKLLSKNNQEYVARADMEALATNYEGEIEELRKRSEFDKKETEALFRKSEESRIKSEAEIEELKQRFTQEREVMKAKIEEMARKN